MIYRTWKEIFDLMFDTGASVKEILRYVRPINEDLIIDILHKKLAGGEINQLCQILTEAHQLG